MITRFVKMQFHSEFVEEFIRIFNTASPLIKKSEGCLSVILIQDAKNKNLICTISEWESEEALNLYRDSELFQLTWNKVKILFETKAEAWSFFRIA